MPENKDLTTLALLSLLSTSGLGKMSAVLKLEDNVMLARIGH